MKTIREWIAARPFVAVGLAVLFSVTSTAAGFREDWRPLLVSMFGCGLMVFVFSMHRFLGLIIAITLALPTKAEEQPVVPVAAGIVVICVGGFCIYKVAKFCQKHFPKEEKKTNELTGFSVTSSDEYGAAWSYNSAGYCYEPGFQLASVEESPTTFNLDVLVGAGATLRTTMSAVTGPGTSQTFSEFKAEVEKHGLFISDHAEPYPHYERNRIPCSEDVVPISFDPLSKAVTHNTGGTMRKVVVERSINLVDWFPLLTTEVSEGTGFRVADCTRENQMFYRVQVIQP